MDKNVNCYSRGCKFTLSQNNTISCSFLKGSTKHNVFDFTANLPKSPFTKNLVEVRFKNTRKDFFINANNINIATNDIVAVETPLGNYDIGIVNAVGDLVYEQLRIYEIDPSKIEKKILRKATPNDIKKWFEAIQLEHYTMIKSRQIAKSLGLEMKIGDVEYQGDKLKATFYYIADERVDFRQLIRILAAEFRIKVEMRQIGVRQEAGRIGGIGTCGRILCCSSWLRKYVSVPTVCIHIQELTANPQKLTGQCSKLKCCLNFEVDVYYDARKNFPENYESLAFKETTLYCQKVEIFRKIFFYGTEKDSLINLFAFPLEKVKEILELNKKGIFPELSNYFEIKKSKFEKNNKNLSF